MTADLQTLERIRVPVRSVVFEGGHEWTPPFLTAAGQFLHGSTGSTDRSMSAKAKAPELDKARAEAEDRRPAGAASYLPLLRSDQASAAIASRARRRGGI
jgi:hypothetical protein